MRLRLIPVLLVVSSVVATVVARAEESLTPPAPLASTDKTVSAGETAKTLSAAQRALEMGFPATAAELYQGLLTAPGVDVRAVTLALSAALIDDGRAPEAEKLLINFKGYQGAAWHLRAGLAAVQTKRIEAARGELPAVREKEGELQPDERGWWFYLQGLLAETGDDRKTAADRAKGFYEQAINAAVSGAARVRFQIAYEQALLRISALSETELEQVRQRLERTQGRAAGYDSARTYAIGLNSLGRRAAAEMFLQQQLLGLPAQERARGDGFRFLLGLIAGAGEGVGRNALLQLLANGLDANLQRMALQLLAEKSVKEPARGELRKEVSRLIAAVPPHAILEDLLLCRANLALGEKNYAAAEDDARALLEKFPGSTLKPLALGVLTSSAWEQQRYRTAAGSAALAAAALPVGPPRAELGVLVAEAWYRAGDFRSAADAYAAVLRNPPAGIEVGRLMFQRVQAEIEAGTPEAAEPLLDELALNPAFDAESRWQAEWNLARALLARGSVESAAVAFARVNRLLAGPAAGLKPELRARMKWLQARLAFDTGEPQRAINVVTKELPPLLEGLETGLKQDIASDAALLRARAAFALKDEAGALAALEKLRVDFPRTSAAVASYIAAASYYAEQEKTVEAQQLYTELAEKFPDDALAPYALYFAALQAERRGQEKDLSEANNRLEDLVKKYPRSTLVFAARLRQGDLLMNLHQFPQAQTAYQALVDNFASNPDVVLAQLAMAKCHNLQSVGEPAHAETALVLFEHLRDRVDAPIDLRVEAGYNRGLLLKRRGELETAAAYWWRDVVTGFLLDPRNAAKLGATGRFWMARTLLELGALREQQGKLEEAKEAWLKIIELKLPDDVRARERLAPYGVLEAKG